MSMIEQQVKNIREVVKSHRPYMTSVITEALTEVADTIEDLFAKLAEGNMERSEVYYGGTKQRSLTINIQINKDETASDIMELLIEIIDEINDKGYGVMNAIVDGKEVFNCKRFSKEFFDSEE